MCIIVHVLEHRNPNLIGFERLASEKVKKKKQRLASDPLMCLFVALTGYCLRELTGSNQTQDTQQKDDIFYI